MNACSCRSAVPPLLRADARPEPLQVLVKLPEKSIDGSFTNINLNSTLASCGYTVNVAPHSYAAGRRDFSLLEKGHSLTKNPNSPNAPRRGRRGISKVFRQEIARYFALGQAMDASQCLMWLKSNVLDETNYPTEEEIHRVLTNLSQPKTKKAPGEGGEGGERRGRKPNPYRTQVTMFLLNNKNANPNDCYQWLMQNYLNPELPQPDLKQIKTLINNIKSNPTFRSQAMY
ncbi:hypothetical protein SPRG_13306 [Saprolegnia parasitica CBS 223.65]|uniref:Uncharacterized protein n=1 Tax=Saprolegnia parasitica (strain CBS 223.65) TaxID=695850 RepID=A0A067BQI2_SAPPC|nr:hypothetical protein SPRG_13306 [Saprolegnia parasitica CBS 223.65]KDO20724.1 hypothetical protein SPRG_13306 [Saprolegnia parasitica CBS 223.65]|eukprot:XP_012208536.1 hypothetical protein SPRG_13306 [Saprolegnia parasitica CBS 223.65]